MSGKPQDWRAGITAGEVITESTLHGDREILAVTSPDSRGNYEGHIIRGANSGMPREKFCFNVAEARVVRAGTGEDREKAGLPVRGPQVQIRIMGPDGKWWQPEQVPAIAAALRAMREDIGQMAGTYTDGDLRTIRAELRKLDAAITARIGEPREASETAPMQPHELGRYVCVLECLHTGPRGTRTIRSDGVWVKHGTQFSSAHRDCYEAWRLDNS